jgi:hypothetical protein
VAYAMPCMAHQAEDEPVLKPKSEAYCLPALIHTPALAIITTTLTASAHLWTPPPPAAAPAGRKPMAEVPTAGLLLLRPASYCCWCDPAGYCCCTRLGGPSTFPLPYGHHHPCCCYPCNLPASAHPPAAAPAKRTPMAHRASCSLVGAGAAAQRAAAALHKARWASCLPVQHTR